MFFTAAKKATTEGGWQEVKKRYRFPSHWRFSQTSTNMVKPYTPYSRQPSYARVVQNKPSSPRSPKTAPGAYYYVSPHSPTNTRGFDISTNCDEVMVRRGFDISTNCESCNRGVIESTLHLFFRCPKAVRLWERMASILGVMLMHMDTTVLGTWQISVSRAAAAGMRKKQW